jgi:hypothetical protein
MSATHDRPKSRAPRAASFRVRFGSLRFYAVLIIAAIGLHYIGLLFDYIPPKPMVVSPDLKKKELDVWSEMNKLLITLATAGIGAIGGYVLKVDKSSPLQQRELRRAAAGWIFCALSLYFGYLSYHEATVMLNKGTFDSNNPGLWVATRAQFWTFLTAVLLFADLVYGAARARRES